jgi:hypothetical protein
VELIIAHNFKIDEEEIDIGSGLANILPGNMKGRLHGNLNVFLFQALQQADKAVAVLKEGLAAAQSHPTAGRKVVALISRNDIEQITHRISGVSLEGQPFGVLTPPASKIASAEEHSSTDSGAVMNAGALHIEHI